jgi:hypothetical protein
MEVSLVNISAQSDIPEKSTVRGLHTVHHEMQTCADLNLGHILKEERSLRVFQSRELKICVGGIDKIIMKNAYLGVS